MYSKEEDEEHWNESSIKGLSFNEDEVSSVSSLFERSYVVVSKKTFSNAFSNVLTPESISNVGKKSIEELLPKKTINLLLDEEDTIKKPSLDPQEALNMLKRYHQNQLVAAPAVQTQRRFLLGEPCSLHLYRSMTEKTEIFHEAVKSGDGNFILTVVLFLRSTLKKKLFCQLLQTRPSAIPIYLNYLITRCEFREGVEILTALGNFNEAAMLDFSVIRSRQFDQKLQRMQSLLVNHFTSDLSNKSFVKNYQTFLEWQAQKVLNRMPETVSQCLTVLCTEHWNEAKGPLSPLTFVALLNISQRQFHWAALNALAAAKLFNELLTLFITKGWMGGKKLNSVLTVETILMRLHKMEAPEVVLTRFIELIDDLDKRLEMAKRLGLHKVSIDTMVTLRDRVGLVQYQTTLTPHSSDFLHAVSALRAAIKWKN